MQTDYNSVVSASFIEDAKTARVVAENQLVACLLFKDRHGELASPEADAQVALPCAVEESNFTIVLTMLQTLI